MLLFADGTGNGYARNYGTVTVDAGAAGGADTYSHGVYASAGAYAQARNVGGTVTNYAINSNGVRAFGSGAAALNDGGTVTMHGAGFIESAFVSSHGVYARASLAAPQSRKTPKAERS